MAITFGDIVAYDGLYYRVVAISEDATPQYTLEPVRKSESALSKTVTSEYVQTDLVPSGGDNLTGVLGADLEEVGSRTGMAKALAEGKIRVKFDSNGGSAVDSQIIDSGDMATEPADPTLEGFTFDGWFYDDGTFLNAVNFVSDTLTDDTTVYAGWTEAI